MGNKLEAEQERKEMVGNGAKTTRSRLRNAAKAREMSYEALSSRMEGNDNERNVDDRNRNYARCVDALTSAFKESSSLTTEEEEKCYDIQDATLTFVDEDDVLDFLGDDYKSRRAKMSCGHAVTPMSLTAWCRRQLDEGGCEFVCGQTGCDVEWPFEEVCKMALLTPKEIEEFEKKIFQNAAKDFLDIKFCPGCKSRVVRTDLNNLSVQCTLCTAKKKMIYIFCWQCLKEWKGQGTVDCGNDDCHNPLEMLKRCPDITFKDVEGVTGCPSVRACPTCGLLVEHDRTKCKNIVCGRCKVKFCFVCLKLTKECQRLKPSSHYERCSSGVAPRQTSIPVWQRT